MLKIIQNFLILTITTVTFVGCNSQTSLQEYLIEKRDNDKFINVDLPVSLLKIDSLNLDVHQKSALESLRKVNVLALQIDQGGKDLYSTEKEKIKQILKGEEYHQLVRFGSNQKGATVSYLGDETAVDEVVFFGNDNEKGLVLLRVLGDDMNPA
ncbi:MAG: DUF4252 domain-containing protein, partial [Flavobacteriaceae bacterium]|nr:DUF4252 domain-containing protein [Flavobacteriaceae bacterium]